MEKKIFRVIEYVNVLVGDDEYEKQVICQRDFNTRKEALDYITEQKSKSSECIECCWDEKLMKSKTCYTSRDNGCRLSSIEYNSARESEYDILEIY